MIDRTELLKGLQALLPQIEKDILAYSEAKPELNAHLKEQYQEACKAERTAEHFVAWREAQITQAAVAWVLTCVFVRFLEDNGLLAEPVLAGPVSDDHGGQPLQQAKERMAAYFNENPTHEERHYLLALFEQLEKFSVIAELLDHRHNPLWQIPVSADGAKRLIDFFQKIEPETGEIAYDFCDAQWDTRFLGDLYQDLSEAVRKRYALLQTPEFVESFILDYTLEPAIESFGLPGLRLIDPTCGSGHFLLTTFERVFERWLKREPATNARVLAQRALDVVHGTDINPYAIAICRFRLFIAAMKAAGSRKIKDAPDFHFHLACGDSLLHGRRFEWEGQGIQQDMLNEKKHVYEVEDEAKLLKILGQRYHVVVGNPPYITVKDKALNQAYRDKYLTCHRKYSLGVPFTERFFDLTLWPEGNQPAGYMGMITTNSFMKREFGKKLIEDYLPRKDLTHVIDTSGAYIPGHGTPTVILFARNQEPRSEQIQAVLGIRGEPGTPEEAANGKVWSSIVQLLPREKAESEFISVVSQSRSVYAQHPWSLGGGGASELKEHLDDKADSKLGAHCEGLGFGAITGEDEVYLLRKNAVSNRVDANYVRVFVEGDTVRDWSIASEMNCIFPYDEEIVALSTPEIEHRLWSTRTGLRSRIYFGKSQAERGMTWYEYGYISKDKCASDFLIPFAFVATHNHFVLDRGGKVFKQSAPVIKLPASATEQDHFALLGLLNSSIGMFWMRQVFHGKGQGGVGQESRAEWEEFREFTGTGLKKFPVPNAADETVIQFAERLDSLSKQLSELSPEICLQKVDEGLSKRLEQFKQRENNIWREMISLQEELDWYAYALYGLVKSGATYEGTALPELALGQRAFEIRLARRRANEELESTWFERHGSTPITETPQHWPEDYRQLVARRLRLMEENAWIKLVEQPEYKRRWNRDSWEERLKAAAKEWLLAQCEQAAQSVELRTCAQLADHLRRNGKVMQVAEVYSGSDMLDLQALIAELIEGDQVPQMAAARLKPTALPKWFAWQEIWQKQRQEDAIDAKYGVDQPLSEAEQNDPDKLTAYTRKQQQATAEKQQLIGDIPVPPQYKQPDFQKASYWTLRGKLDVPKERFFSLPGAEKAGDNTLVIGWAGLNHLQRAQAIATWYLERKENEGWEAEQLKPMLVALNELLPWLKQWHNEIDPEYGERMGDYYEGFLLEELRQLDLSRETLLKWVPVARPSKKRAPRKTAKA